MPVMSSMHIRPLFNLFVEELIRSLLIDHLMIGDVHVLVEERHLLSDTEVVLREVKAEWQRPFRMAASTSLGLQ